MEISWICHCMNVWLNFTSVTNLSWVNKKLEIYFFSFWGVHQHFEFKAGLNYRFIGNLHVHVFVMYIYKTRIRLLQMTSLGYTGTGRCCKKVFLACSSWHISFFQKPCLSSLCWNLIFETNFVFFGIFLDFLKYQLIFM